MWVLVPRLSPSAQALEDWTSPPKWSLELAESVTWRGKQRASSSWLRAWKKGGWIRRLFTRMPEPSMADRGVAEWISSLPVTRASRSVSLAKDSQKQTQGTSGPTSSGSSEKYSQPSLFSRTSKDTSSEASAPSSVTLTNWGSMRSGEFIQQPKPDTPTAATESSSWPTATMMDGLRAGKEENYEEWKKARDRHAAKGVNKHFHLNAASSKWAALWPTPNASLTNDGESVEGFEARQAKWAHKYHNSMPLTVKVKQWPTPRAITGGAESAQRKQELGRTLSGGSDLQAEAQNWATPTARDYKDGTDPSPNAPTNALLGRQALRVTGQMSPSSTGRRLNPWFVEWLMSFPAGWTVCEPSETLSAQRRQLWHCGTSSGGCADG